LALSCGSPTPLVVASAGNGGPAAAPAYPAALRHVVAVTAVDQANRIYRYANQGAYIVVAAPGVREPGAAASGGYKLYSGTSFAAPHISAWLARCLGGRKSQTLAAATQCRKQLTAAARDTGAPGVDPVYGSGVVR
ncbi:MAG: S8 family serine peptidase, partial [Sphingomicrobium sp.]